MKKKDCFYYIGNLYDGWLSDDWVALLKAVAKVESNNNPSLKPSPKDAYGCFRITKIKARDVWNRYPELKEIACNFEDFWLEVRTNQSINTIVAYYTLRDNYFIIRKYSQKVWDDNDAIKLSVASYRIGKNKIIDLLEKAQGKKKTAEELLENFPEIKEYVEKVWKFYKKYKEEL